MNMSHVLYMCRCTHRVVYDIEGIVRICMHIDHVDYDEFWIDCIDYVCIDSDLCLKSRLCPARVLISGGVERRATE